ncbi:MAG: hypothetical protein KIT69_07250 [Propionibacteriaceae bacterium]|nr:hypothetical protein [Propionibacteriaceae bacterium]
MTNDYEQLFRDGLRRAARRRPPSEIDLTEVTAKAPEVDDTPAGPKPRIATRWAIGLSAVAAGVAMLLVLPGVLGSRPIEALPVQTPTPPLPTATASPTVTPPVPTAASSAAPTRWAYPQTLAPADLPLTPYWDAIRKAEEYEDHVVASSAYGTWLDKREKYLATCMAKEGFDYFPWRNGWDGPEPGSEAEARYVTRTHNRLRIPTLDPDRAVVAQVGYGLRSAEDYVAGEDPGLIDDPRNVPYVESLSEGERKRYQAELGGCQALFQRKDPIPEQSYEKDFIRERFGDLLSDLIGFHSLGAKDDIEADPRIIQLNSEWRACVVPSGLSIEQARGRAKRPGPWDGPMEAMQIAFRTGADGVAADPGDYDLERVDQQSLIGSDPEIRIALIDYDCRAATDYLDRFVAVQREREQKFIETNREQLDKLMAYIDSYVP